ncbi:hypothetical protein SDC9_132316 [bioreactor metagenome]|uniref:Uncharacterized protein n=1 Tax=bioreactor metagenome TaxID=1076179 RepID=A0A645D850_9ZZZZ
MYTEPPRHAAVATDIRFLISGLLEVMVNSGIQEATIARHAIKRDTNMCLLILVVLAEIMSTDLVFIITIPHIRMPNTTNVLIVWLWFIPEIITPERIRDARHAIPYMCIHILPHGQ